MNILSRASGIFCAKYLVLLALFLPLSALGQIILSGKVINAVDKKPLDNVNVFLKNTSIGNRTDDGGSFKLIISNAGQYELVISMIGFETYVQPVTIINQNVSFPDIELIPRTQELKEVKINFKADPNRQRNLEWFKDEFLGASEFSKSCTILNPDVIDITYDEATAKLIASSYDFIIIENNALGYKVKYLLNNFVIDRSNINEQQLHFDGSVLFEELAGTARQKAVWKRNRQSTYEGSSRHFFRSLINDRIEEEGFRVFEYSYEKNPNKRADSLIKTKIKLFTTLKNNNNSYKDSLTFWKKQAKLPAILGGKIINKPLSKADIVDVSVKQGIYVLKHNGAALCITFAKDHNFSTIPKLANMDDQSNETTTLIKFTNKNASFGKNSGFIEPNSVLLSGAWGRPRVAEQLPVDYESQQTKDTGDIAYVNFPAQLKSYLAIHPTEKAYLHFDKSYYAAGDSMYFEAYVTTGERHQLSTISGVLHVDLINPGNKIEKSIMLPLVNGIASGDFALPDTLSAGNYRVRAWTRLMRNAGDDSFFEKQIQIGSLQNAKIPESATFVIRGKADIRFLPEGGDLVNGISSTVAFKAINVDGKGIAVTGIVNDETGKEVTRFSSTNMGMGSFLLKPEPGKNYSAIIRYADGSQTNVSLPKSKDEGIVLSVNNDSIPKATVKISASQNYYNARKDKEFALLIWSGGKTTIVPFLLDSTEIRMDVLKRRLMTGVATITLFSMENEPLAERLIFVQNYDQLNVNVQADRDTYSKKEKVSLKLNIKDRAENPAMGHFSVSITDESKVPVDENQETTILSELLLSSDLKGIVEQPNYYFNNINDQTQKELDLVMLTHGYRRFQWKQVLDKGTGEHTSVAYQPETGLEISGTASSLLLGKPLVNGTVSLISPKGGAILSDTTDKKGNFHFSNLVFADTSSFVLQAITAKGKNTTKLTYKEESEPSIHNLQFNKSDTNKNMQTYLKNAEKQQEELNRLGLGKGKMLKEVKIKARKKDESDGDYRSSSLAGPGHADQVIHRKDIENIGGELSVALNGRLRGVRFASNGNPIGGIAVSLTGEMLVVIDGVPMQKGYSINNIVTSTVETVEVLKGANASIYGMNAGNDVIVITTRQGESFKASEIASIGILPITAKGFYKAREFYSPKYTATNSVNNIKDLRSTIYWHPELRTDKDGKAPLEYYNADGTGNYRVVIEGIDEKGNIARYIYRYKVE